MEKDIMKCEKERLMHYNITKNHLKEDLTFSKRYEKLLFS